MVHGDACLPIIQQYKGTCRGHVQDFDSDDDDCEIQKVQGKRPFFSSGVLELLMLIASMEVTGELVMTLQFRP